MLVVAGPAAFSNFLQTYACLPPTILLTWTGEDGGWKEEERKTSISLSHMPVALWRGAPCSSYKLRQMWPW